MPRSPHKTEDDYATVIQSQWRGHQVRRSLQGAPGSLSASRKAPSAAPTPSKARSVAASRAASNAEALLVAQASQQLLQQASAAGGLGASSRAASLQPPQPQYISSHGSGHSVPSSNSSAQSLQQQQQQMASGGLPAQPSAGSYRSSSSSQQAAAMAAQHSSRSLAPSQHPFDASHSAAASAAGTNSYGTLPPQQASQTSLGAGASHRESLSAQSSAYHSVYDGTPEHLQGQVQGAGLAAQRSKQAAGLSKAPSAASLPPSISQQQLAGPGAAFPPPQQEGSSAAAGVGSLRPSATAGSQAASAAASRQPSSGSLTAPGSTHSSSRQPGPPSQQASWGQGAAAGAASFGGFGPPQPQQEQSASPGGHPSGAASAASSRPVSAAPSQKSLHPAAQQQQQLSRPGSANSSSRSLAAPAPPGPAIPSGLLPPGAGGVGGRGAAAASPAPRPALGYLGSRRGPAGGRLAAEASVADEVDPDKRLMVKNVGALRAAAARRRPPPEVELLEDWHGFAGRQVERYVPAPPNPHRLVKPQSQPYRISVHCVKGLPTTLPSSSGNGSSSPRKGAAAAAAGGGGGAALPGMPGSSYEFQLGVSLYDESLGAFYGATCYSGTHQALSVPGAPGAAQQGLAGPGGAAGGHLSVDFGFEAFFHSRIADPQCMAVVEVILVDRSSSKGPTGAPQGRYSVGWAMLPLFPSAAALQEGGQRGGAAAGGQAGVQPGQVMVMPVLAGTPRYLMFRSVQAGELPPPRILEGCHVVFQVDPYPALSTAQCLVPPDFPVTSRELIPGLRRFKLVTQAAQQVAAWSSDIKGVTSTLAEPVLSPVAAVTLSALTVSVPQVLHSLLAALPHVKGARTPPHDLSTALAVAPAPTAVRYTLQYGVHNGRCFVGPLLSTPELVVAPQLGVVALQVPPGAAAPLLPWVLRDVCCVVVVQLLAAQAVPAAHAAPVVVGRAAFSPHLAVSPDGNTAELAAGPHRYALASCCRDPNSCSTLFPTGGTPALLDWRTLLQDTATQLLPDPTVSFQLDAAGVTPGMPGSPAAAAALAPVAAAARQLSNARSGRVDSAAPSQAPTPPPPPPQQQASERALRTAAERAQSSGFVDTPRTNAAVAAAQELERAATMPLEEQPGPSALPPGARDMLTEAWHHQQMVAAAAAAAAAGAGHGAGGGVHSRELASITETMQVQLHQLARAVAELKEERATLRQSLNLQSSVLQAAAAAAAASAASRPGSPVLLGLRQGSPDHPGAYSSAAAAAAGGAGLSPEEQQLFDSLPGVRHAGLAAAGGGGLFQGAVADGEVMGAGGYGSLPLGRALMQQLHEAGMQHALPSDVRHALQRAPQGASGRTAASLTPATLPLALDLESKDARTRSELILQLLSFKPSGDSWGAAGASGVPSCLYFTMQLYQFEAVVTEAALLSGAGEAGYHVILPVAQGQQAGAGLVLKHVVDGSEVPLAPGVSPGQAAHAEHLAFSSYLATRQLVVDVWDGESLLQLGSASISLQGLLRQGRELAEIMVEAPILSCDASSATLPGGPAAAAAAASSAAGASGSGSGRSKGVVGQLVVRLINMGRPSCRGATRLEDFDCGGKGQGSGPGTPVKKVRCRAVPYEPSSPVAQELCGLSGGANPNSPFSIDWAAQEGATSTTSTLRGTLDPNQTQEQQQQQQTMLGSGQLGATGSPRMPGGTSTGNVTADILNFEHRKMVRERHLRQLSSSPNGSPSRGSTLQRPGSPWSPGSPLGSPSATLASPGAPGVSGGAEGDQGESFKELQRQMLADVAAVRRRQKATFMKSQLRKGLVTQFPVSCCPGETRLLLFTLSNPLPREAIFTLSISHPQLLAPIEQRQELQLLKAALDQSCVVHMGGSSSGSGPGKGQEGQQGAVAAVTPLHELASRQLAGGQQQEGKQGIQEQLSSGGKIFLAANEAVVVPFKYMLPRTARSPLSRQQGLGGAAGSSGSGEAGSSWWLEPHTVMVEFVPEGHSHPAAVLELLATPKPLIVDRTLRYYCPERDLLQVSLPLSSSSSSRAGGLPVPAQGVTGLASAAAGGAYWTAVSDNQLVMLAVAAPAAPQQQQQQLQGGRGHSGGSSGEAGGAQLSLRFKCGTSPEVCHFHVWVYADALQARPLEVWQVFVHSLKKVDITAQVGSTTTAALAIRGAASDRQVATYSSKPSLLQPQPPHMLLPAGGVAELGLVFRPVTTGTEQVRVHLVDLGSRELAQAFIVAVTGTPPAYNRSFEVEVPVGASVHKKVSYSNPYQQQRSLLLSTNLPGVLSFQPQHVDLTPGGSHPIGMVFSGPAAAAAAGVAPGAQAVGQQVELFVFLNDVDERGEECWRVVVRLV